MGDWQIGALFPQQPFQIYGLFQGISQGMNVCIADPEVFEQPVQLLSGMAQAVLFTENTSAALTFPGGQKFIQQMVQVSGEIVLPLGLDQVDLLLGKTHRLMDCLCLSVESRQEKHPLNGQLRPNHFQQRK